VNLGSSPLQAGGAGSGGVTSGPRNVWGVQTQPLLAQEANLLLANPTLTALTDELYYSAQMRFGVPDPNMTRIMRRVRDGAGWGKEAVLTFGDLMMQEVVSPAISANGQELWLGMNTAGSTDIFKSTRQADAWSTPQLVSELSDDMYDDAPRPPAVNGTIMPLSSKRHGGMPLLYQIYFATRASSDAAWGEPSKALLGSVDSDAFQSADGFLSHDGLELYFSSTRDGEHKDSDLFVARRANLDAPFGEPEALSDLNDPDPSTPSEERMPWLSPDGSKLYFVSDHSGQYTLYLATKL
jgi:WD40-like Beta Propeller Repeat